MFVDGRTGTRSTVQWHPHLLSMIEKHLKLVQETLENAAASERPLSMRWDDK
jgi:hypothetical protein